MIIDCTYITNADNGVFESEAKLDTKTGVLFDIKSCDDEDQNDTNSVKSEEISFILEGKEYVFKVTFTDSDYILENEQDLAILKTLNFENYLKENLSEKTEIKSKLKL